MKSAQIKFYSVLLLHTLLFIGFISIITLVPGMQLSLKEFSVALVFSVFYFALVWFDLYSRPYHQYLKKAFFFIFRNLFVCSVGLFIFEQILLLFYPYDGPASLYKNLLIVLFYTLVQLLQYFWIIHLATLGFFRKNVVLVGSFDSRLPVEPLFQNINNTKNFLGQLVIEKGVWKYRANLESNFLTLEQSLSSFFFSKSVNELIICIDKDMTSSALAQCASWCRENSIGYYLIPDLHKIPHVFPWENKFRSIPSIERYCPNRDSLIMISIKRLLDLACASFALILLSPVMLVIAILIKKEDGGKIFYTSTRVGIHKKPIKFHKFRSMVPNAEALKKDLLALNERPDGPLFKLQNDPRVTKIGAFLRKTSLDEIPQFWNVLIGDMSLIGPRPHLPSEVESYNEKDNLRLECIPGISCLPQIYGRDTLGFREWVDLDLEYRKNWSLFYDFKILFKTVKVVFHI